MVKALDPKLLLKAKMGEALVAALFQAQGWHIERIGLEHQLAIEQRGLDGSRGSRAISDMPDLLAYQERTDGVRVVLVEVKTHKLAPPADQLERYARFDGVVIAWVSPTGIRASWVIADEQGLRVPQNSQDYKPIEHVDSLWFDESIMDDFHDMAGHLHQAKAPERTPMAMTGKWSPKRSIGSS